jgi:hypothetical protein
MGMLRARRVAEQVASPRLCARSRAGGVDERARASARPGEFREGRARLRAGDRRAERVRLRPGRHGDGEAAATRPPERTAAPAFFRRRVRGAASRNRDAHAVRSHLRRASGDALGERGRSLVGRPGIDARLRSQTVISDPPARASGAERITRRSRDQAAAAPQFAASSSTAIPYSKNPTIPVSSAAWNAASAAPRSPRASARVPA